MNSKEDIRESVRKNYGKIASDQRNEEDCSCSPGCCTGAPLDLITIGKRLGYSPEELEQVPKEANMGLGCGNPLALLALQQGQTVLDLGSGGGFDCFIAREKVGAEGLVIGVDMTPEMIKLARANAEQKGFANVQFRLGEIENLPVADNFVDVIISNCVLNLSPEKGRVFQEAHRVLRPGGKLAVADVVAVAEMPQEIKEDLGLVSSCVAGAEQVDTLWTLLEEAGFVNIRMTPKENSDEVLTSWSLEQSVGKYVASYIIEAEKVN